MKWILIGNGNTGKKEYQLIQDDLVLVVMKYNPEHHSLRINFQGQHQVYFMETLGYTNRIALKNVYGIDVGKFSRQRNHTGRLEINREIFDYHIVDNNQPKLIIHQHDQQQPLVVCQLSSIPVREWSSYEEAGLVLSLCSYATIPVEKQRQQPR
ncbi:hypothetical protein [Longitalea luteola]|uniref:hypothetical protein n=1 Tax=Longitalea luteola TaxID=2812563 RepID=UPI001A97C4CA|nr:hypothetical protein [Longitalea luteola]